MSISAQRGYQISESTSTSANNKYKQQKLPSDGFILDFFFSSFHLCIVLYSVTKIQFTYTYTSWTSCNDPNFHLQSFVSAFCLFPIPTTQLAIRPIYFFFFWISLQRVKTSKLTCSAKKEGGCSKWTRNLKKQATQSHIQKKMRFIFHLLRLSNVRLHNFR